MKNIIFVLVPPQLLLFLLPPKDRYLPEKKNKTPTKDKKKPKSLLDTQLRNPSEEEPAVKKPDEKLYSQQIEFEEDYRNRIQDQ